MGLGWLREGAENRSGGYGGLSEGDTRAVWASGLEEGGEKGLGSGEELVEGFGSVWDL